MRLCENLEVKHLYIQVGKILEMINDFSNEN